MKHGLYPHRFMGGKNEHQGKRWHWVSSMCFMGRAGQRSHNPLQECYPGSGHLPRKWFPDTSKLLFSSRRTSLISSSAGMKRERAGFARPLSFTVFLSSSVNVSTTRRANWSDRGLQFKEEPSVGRGGTWQLQWSSLMFALLFFVLLPWGCCINTSYRQAAL